MIIIQGKQGKGVKRELIKRFCEDCESATLLTDELNTDDILTIINDLKKDGLEISDEHEKNIRTNLFVNCEEEFYLVLGKIDTQSIYVDLCISDKNRLKIKDFCMGLEREYGMQFIFTEQLSLNSKKDINIIEI